MKFPGANTNRDAADYIIVGAPLDVSTTFQPGTRFGPNRIRKFSASFEDYDERTDTRFTELKVHDRGDIYAWDNAQEYVEHLSHTISDVVHDDALPLLLGGEHTVSIAGVQATTPDVFVCLDAHLDLRAAFDGNQWSHSTVTYQTLEIVEEAVLIGARTGSEPEWERAAKPDVQVVSPESVAEWSMDMERDVYLSVDIDAADPGFAPGTGTKEPFGLTPREMRDIVREIAPYAIGFDVVEVNDRDNGQAATLAGKLLREFVHSRAAST